MTTLSPIMPSQHFAFRDASVSYRHHSDSQRPALQQPTASYPSPPQESKSPPLFPTLQLPPISSFDIPSRNTAQAPSSPYSIRPLGTPPVLSPTSSRHHYSKPASSSSSYSSPSLYYSQPVSSESTHFPRLTTTAASIPSEPISHGAISPLPSLPSPTSDSHRPACRKGPWNSHEDELLKYLVARQRDLNPTSPPHWGEISKGMNEMRTAKQCRERYTQNLDPELNREPLSAEEGAFVLAWVKTHGKQWAELSRQPQMKRRSDNHIKNWWNGHNKEVNEESRSARKVARRGSNNPSLPSPRAASGPQHATSPSSVSSSSRYQHSSSPPQHPQSVRQLPLPAFSPSRMVISSNRMTMDSILN